MRLPVKLLFLCALAGGLSPVGAQAAKQTVCTITVNSADEKAAFRRHLPPDKYEFVELVEKNREDWLDSACRAGVRCDVLVISGHYDGGNEFFSDQVTTREFLPVAEMERVSCSNSCPGLFSQLKEVYLFGCNTLNPQAQRSASAEVVRSLMRGGASRADAERLARTLNERHGESSRDRMRLVFKDVPAIYGFSSVAPLGPLAGSILDRYFQNAGSGEIGTGRTNGRMLATFSAQNMAVTRGITDADPAASVRRDVCEFADDRIADPQRLEFVRGLLQRPMAEVRMFLDRIERYVATLDAGDREDPATAQALAAIAADTRAKGRFLEFARDADEPAIRARMLALAQAFDWLTPEAQRGELLRMFDELLARNAVGAAEVDLACTLNREHALDGAYEKLEPGAAGAVPYSALRACFGSAPDRLRTVDALFGASDADAEIAQTYLRHWPLADVAEIRKITSGIAGIRGQDAQVRALYALGRQRVSDPESLEALVRLFPAAESWDVQSAIAGILIRADFATLARPELVQTLRERRRKSPYGEDIIDALIRRLQAQ
jgi:hypothetical protein